MNEQQNNSKILDLTADQLPSKRETCMVQPPSVYEVSNCPKCGNANTAWSEYENHVWCFDCEIDYEPECGGIFDGPILAGVARLMGISLDRIEIATGRVITLDEQMQTKEGEEVQ